ncbi:hypothetical protein RclHR1_13020002 [Rhizophagus clarus]|uniref:Phosphatidylglycerol/phosphatidylinositol transfer protein n=1 Tax=Rhizophagus clarus TaxID=94130 RepID=A0A2Z6R1R3_9GLOM|nr:hypothetical protein RclHR1_13020002 [Rhizophagus clarus]GES97251.1 hypothetical protein GLOIN_2v1722203 [Rhizophagus clarus]
MVNAQITTIFTACPKDNPPLLDISLDRDPVVPGASIMFGIHGLAEKDITLGSTLAVGFFTLGANPTTIGDPFYKYVCDLAPCPIQIAGYDFLLRALVPIPANLPTAYMIIVFMKYPTDTYIGCAAATVDPNETPSPEPFPTPLI